MTIDQILNQYDLPHKFLVRFALYCTNDARHLMKDPRSIKALDVTQRWLDGEATEKEIEDAVKDSAYSAARSASSAKSAAYSVAATAHSATDTAYYVARSYHYARVASGKDYTSKLLEMIEELTPLEKMLYEK